MEKLLEFLQGPAFFVVGLIAAAVGFWILELRAR